MAQLLLGKEVTASLNKKIRTRAAALKEKGCQPTLAIVRCGEDPSDISYERGIMKRAKDVGVAVANVYLPWDVDKEILISEIERLGGDEKIHGVLLARPLPGHLRAFESEICNRLLPDKDVDGMTDISQAGVYEGKALGFPPCTPQACMEILDYYGVAMTGKRVVVIGRSLVVGRPVAMMLMARNATVTVCHTKTVDVAALARSADILVSSAGVLGSLTRDFVRPGQIVIDVSINYDPTLKNGRGGIAGDAVFEEIEPIVEAITPVPGGVGSVTTSVLCAHVVTAAERTIA